MPKVTEFVLDANSRGFDHEDAEQLARELSAQAYQARLSVTPTINMYEGRINAYFLKQMFDQVYPDKPSSASYWSNKLMYKLESEWLDGKLALEVHCDSCKGLVQPGGLCNRKIDHGRQTRWHFPVYISAASIIREQHNFKLRRGERRKTVENFNCMIRSLQQAVAQ